MKRCLGTVVALCVLLLGAGAFADELTLKDAQKAFAQLKTKHMAKLGPVSGGKGEVVTYNVKNKKGEKEEVKVWVGSPVLLTPVDVPTGPGKVSLGVKVWAELSDPSGTHSGKFVNIQRYKWGQKEHFYFWFESAAPVQMSLVQYYDVGPSEAKDPKLVSPNPDFPKTYSTVLAGEKACFPQLFRTDETNADEFAMLTLVAAGAEVTPPASPGGKPTPPPINTPQTPGEVGGIGAVFSATNNFFVALSPKQVSFAKGPRSPRLLQAVDSTGVPNPAKKPDMLDRMTSDRPDEVTLFVLGNQTVGHLPLRFWK